MHLGFQPCNLCTAGGLLIIRFLRQSDLESLCQFSDDQIGQGYFTLKKLEQILKASTKNGIVCSFVLEDDSGIQGIRLTYPPGQWLDRDPRQAYHPHLWKCQENEAGYFQSLFIAKSHQAKGYGQRLSMASIEHLKMCGAKAVVCHSWDESPHNSSRRYLDSLGFEPIKTIPNYWNCIDYTCTRCGKPCVCTATEMIKYF